MKSIISLVGEHESSCGYCKNQSHTSTTSSNTNTNTNSSISYGIISNSMNIEDYEALMLIGWRRSGNYFYKPNMFKTCCPQYTIRLHVPDYIPSKHQKQLCRKFQRYLETDDIHLNPINSSMELDKNHKDNLSHTFTIVTVPAELTQERFELYKKYQVEIHKDSEDEITQFGFKNFLVDSPLNQKQDIHNNKSITYGTFHQLYRIDDELVAVGVVDILPSGLSSVYFFYDPAKRFLVLGKYSAYCEIEYCKQNQLAYYYMGFYIDSCEKMRYKGEFSPSELLCPTTLQWYYLKDILHYFRKEKFKFCPLDKELHDLYIKDTNNLYDDNSSYREVDKSNTTIERKYSPRLNKSDDNFKEIELLLSSDQNFELYFFHLEKRGQEIVKEYLLELQDVCGYEILKRIKIRLF